MRRAAKVDATQRAIVQALERAGCLVWYIREPFDLLVSRAGRLYLLECKTLRKQGGRETLTKSQEKALAAGWPATVVWDAGQALRAVGLFGPPGEWAVFCPICDARWFVPFQHSGKQVCSECIRFGRADSSAVPF